MPRLCPVCFGSGYVVGTNAGGPPYVPVTMSNHPGYAIKCSRCNTKGWLVDGTVEVIISG
jgi:hypothetical protein